MSKMEVVVARWRAGEAQMQDNPGRGESDAAEGIRRRCMKNSPSVLSCIGKWTREGCDRGSEVGNSLQGMRRRRGSSSEETEGIWQGREL